MTEYTYCPGNCRSPRGKVKIWGHNEISYCCHPCWTRTWASIQGEPIPIGPKHSDRCVDRQDERFSYRTIPTGDREWMISGPRRTSNGAPVLRPSSNDPDPWAEVVEPGMRWGIRNHTRTMDCTPIPCPPSSEITFVRSDDGRVDLWNVMDSTVRGGDMSIVEGVAPGRSDPQVVSVLEQAIEDYRRGYFTFLETFDDTPVREVP